MIGKAVILAFLAVGVLGDLQVSPDQKKLAETHFTEFCKKNGAEDKVDAAKAAGSAFVECLKSEIEIDTIKSEIEKAKPNGALDEVFKKYCDKSPKFKSCINNGIDGLAPCLPANIKTHVPAMKSGLDQILDFVCHKDGDRIALFIAEGGPECFQSKMNDLKQCIDNMKTEIDTVEKAQALTLSQQCTKYDQLSSCIVTKLESCNTPTPGNMAEALFRFVRKGSPCEKK